jgi:3-oxoacyl-[acyl-carrier-protein] synthase II
VSESYSRTGLDIAVTGIGAIAANGHTAGEIWSNCLAGVSGIARFDNIDCSGLEVDFGGAIRNFDFEPFIPLRQQLTYDLSQLYAAAAASMALDDAGGRSRLADAATIGVVIGTGAGALRSHDANSRAAARTGRIGVSAHYAPVATVSLSASLPAMLLGIRGPTFAVSGACATAAYNLISAAHLLVAGDADIVLAGAVDAMALPLAIMAFENMRGLARNADPTRACRPLDRGRNGLVLAEGASVFALERLDAAASRGAHVYGVLCGYGMSSDAGSLVAANADGIGRACRTALTRAGVSADEIDHVNLHAAGTQQGDLAEAQALHEVFGMRASDIPVTAAKSMLGHAMGASSGLETMLLLKTLETGTIPPTLNLEQPDPAVDLKASTKPVQADVRAALKTASGIGGLNAALVFRNSA